MKNNLGNYKQELKSNPFRYVIFAIIVATYLILVSCKKENIDKPQVKENSQQILNDSLTGKFGWEVVYDDSFIIVLNYGIATVYENTTLRWPDILYKQNVVYKDSGSITDFKLTFVKMCSTDVIFLNCRFDKKGNIHGGRYEGAGANGQTQKSILYKIR